MAYSRIKSSSYTWTKELKQVIKNSGVDPDFVKSGKETIGKIVSSNDITFIQEEDSQLAKYTTNEKNHNYLVNKLKKKKNLKKYEKNTNQLLIESLDRRGNTLQFFFLIILTLFWKLFSV